MIWQTIAFKRLLIFDDAEAENQEEGTLEQRPTTISRQPLAPHPIRTKVSRDLLLVLGGVIPSAAAVATATATATARKKLTGAARIPPPLARSGPPSSGPPIPVPPDLSLGLGPPRAPAAPPRRRRQLPARPSLSPPAAGSPAGCPV